MKILISRTDKLGDVALTLPMAGWLKKQFKDCKVYFLGRTYTEPLIRLSTEIDEFINWDQLSKDTDPVMTLKTLNLDVVVHVFPNKEFAFIAKKAGIPLRVGTSHRWYHWLTCNERPSFSRRKSPLHESELNFKLLSFFKKTLPTLPEIPAFLSVKGLENLPLVLKKKFTADRLSSEKINIILHPKSKGSAREWPLNYFSELIEKSPKHFQFYVTGGPDEKDVLAPWIAKHQNIIDLTGSLNLKEFCEFIATCDGLIAASTGPLHIAGILGRQALGLYPPIEPMHPGRWAPLGKRAETLVANKNCSDCRTDLRCACMELLTPEMVLKVIMRWQKIT